MPKSNQKLFFQQCLLFRKEYFGVLILMGDGRRYSCANRYFDDLRALYKKHRLDANTSLSDKNGKVFLNFLIDNKIVGSENKKAKVRFVKNNFISKDCLSFPRTVYWECTQRCNFNCIHCYSSSGNKLRSGELTLKQAKSLIEELSAKGAEFLSIGGGEPLLYPYLNEVVEFAKKKLVSVEVSTNASLVTDKSIKALKAAGLKFIQVSLDGACNRTYGKIRQGGDFATVTKNIKKLSKHFIVSICMVVNRINYQEVGDVIDLAIKLGVKFFRIIPFMEVGRAAGKKELQLKKSELRDVYRRIKNKRKETAGKILIQLNENLIVPERKNIAWMPKNHYGCSAGRSTCGLDSHGNVYPCSYMVFDELICGNIQNQSLADIWKKSPVMEKMRSISFLKGKCSKCKHLDLCRGGCRAAAYLKRHDLRDSDDLCSVK